MLQWIYLTEVTGDPRGAEVRYIEELLLIKVKHGKIMNKIS